MLGDAFSALRECEFAARFLGGSGFIAYFCALNSLSYLIMTPYTDLFCDFDDTLYDTRGNAIMALAELYDFFHLENHFERPELFYDAYWQTNVELWGLYAKGEIERHYLIVERFRRPLSLGRGLEEVSEERCLEISDKFLALCAVKPGLVEGAKELVDYLRTKGYRLHICSNGFHEVQYKKLRACGLLECFETIVLSEDAGANKPSKQFFDYALEVTKADPKRTLMIGDNFSTDIQGAMGAGIDTLFFNRWQADFVPPQQPTFMVNRLKEIEGIL